MSKNKVLKDVHESVIQRSILLGEYNPDKSIDEQSDLFYNEYVQYVQDELTTESRKPGSVIWKEARKTSPSFGNMFRGTMLGGKIPIIGKGGDFTLKTPQDAMNYLANFIHSWNMDGDLSKQTLRKMEAMKTKEKETWAKTIEKSSNVQSLLDRFDINEDNFTSLKLDRMVNQTLGFKPKTETQIAKGQEASPIDMAEGDRAYFASEFGQEVMPIVVDITKRLYDKISENAKKDLSRDEYMNTLISLASL